MVDRMGVSDEMRLCQLFSACEQQCTCIWQPGGRRGSTQYKMSYSGRCTLKPTQLNAQGCMQQRTEGHLKAADSQLQLHARTRCITETVVTVCITDCSTQRP